MAERSADHAMDAAESELTFGKPAFKIALMSALFVERNRFEEAEAARESLSPICVLVDSQHKTLLHCRARPASFPTGRKVVSGIG
jgi:hypothetical protein